MFAPRVRFLRGGGAVSDAGSATSGESLARARDDVLGVVELGDPVSCMNVRFFITSCSASIADGMGSALLLRTGGVGNVLVLCAGSGSDIGGGGVRVLGLTGESRVSRTSPSAFASVLDFERADSGIGGMMNKPCTSVLIGYGCECRGRCAY